MIGFIKRMLANRIKLDWLTCIHSDWLAAHSKILLAGLLRQEELFDHQAKTIKLAAQTIGQAEMVAMAIAAGDSDDREQILERARAAFPKCVAARKELLDWVARMESESDQRRGVIEEFMEAMARAQMSQDTKGD